MSLEIVRRIRGNVHGTIDVSALEDAVMSHHYVQRLRRIKQLAFLHYVFPGATHTRFEHSLGVMQLAGIAWEKMRVNQTRLAEVASKQGDFLTKERSATGQCHGLLAPTFTLTESLFSSDYNLQVLRLAGFLHDIGHPPFSHSGERFLPTWNAVLDANKDAPDYLVEWMQRSCEKLRKEGKDPNNVKVRHEVYSILLIEKILSETYRNFKHLSLEIDPRDVIAVISPEITPAAHSPLLAHATYKMLHELISAELDIDRMDYLLRDSRECGVVYGIFDVGRILDGLCIYQDQNDRSLHVAITHSGLAAFEDYLRARQSMYLQVYFHKTSAGAEAMMSHVAKRIEPWTLPAAATEFAECDEYNIFPMLSKAAKLRFDDVYEIKDFEIMAKDLFFNRKLWKRVYEVTAREHDTAAHERLQLIHIILKELNIDYEYVSSLTSLTRFRPREAKQQSQNYLRLIVRDDLNLPRVVPIEDHWSIAEQNARIRIHRFYVKPEDASSSGPGNDVREKIQQKIASYAAKL